VTPLPVIPPVSAPVLSGGSQKDGQLRAAAVQLEATFLSEMLKSAGFGSTSETFGGGVGEDQFGSFLREAQALELAKAGGIGLAEALFEALKVRLDG